MKTHYKILWVDHEFESIETDIENIEEFFEDYGIEAIITKLSGGTDTDDTHEDIKKELDDPDIDLIVVDFLMDKMNGAQLIEIIRETNHIFLPVVFYSKNFEDLREKAAESLLDGVYLSPRDAVSDKIQEVAKSLLRKEQTSKRTRGLLMEGVSELDASFGSIFLSLWDKLGEKQKRKIIKCFKEKLDNKYKSTKELMKSLPDDPLVFRADMKSNFVSFKYNMVTRWRILKEMFELLGMKGNEVDTFCRLYSGKDRKPLIEMRNEYAHKTRSELEEEHNEGVCKSIRLEIRSQMKNTLEDIPKRLGMKQ